MDNRGRKTSFRSKLKEYLEQELFLVILNNKEKEFNFNIEYKDSKTKDKKINIYFCTLKKCATVI